MSIRKARLNGEAVYSSQGEQLRGKDVVCMHCRAKMHIHKFPGKDDYYFALNPNEKHTSVCQHYDGTKDAPVLDGLTPASLIALLSTPKKQSTNKNGGRSNSVLKGNDSGDKDYKPKKISSLAQIIKVGMYDVLPFEPAFEGTELKNIDFFIFDKWGELYWNDRLIPIREKIIDARWLGSFSNSESRTVARMIKTHELWFEMFWIVDDTYTSVRFCLDASTCFAAIKKKLFTSGIRENDTYNDYVPKIDKLDVLIAARWAAMNKEQCSYKCPIKRCKGCLGAYWGKINTAKQIELFPADAMYKNQENNDDD